MSGEESRQTILVIEDERDLLDGLEEGLGNAGFRVLGASTGEEGIALAVESSPDLIVLDVMLPGMDGFEVCRRLREKSIETPIIILSARSAEIDKVLGLEIGADDYVTKPFSLRELRARIRARLREKGALSAAASDEVSFGGVSVDFQAYTVHRGSEEIQLTPTEFEILRVLVSRKGAAVSREHLLQEVFGYSKDAGTRTIDTHILNLRHKLEADPAQPRHIRTVYGQGYRFFD